MFYGLEERYIDQKVNVYAHGMVSDHEAIMFLLKIHWYLAQLLARLE